MREEAEFRETLARPVPGTTYRSDIVDDMTPTLTEQLVRVVTSILLTLLALRFAMNLFTHDRTIGLVNLLNGATDWLVAPFQAVFGSPGSNPSGFFDLPAVAAFAVLVALASFVGYLLNRPGSDDIGY
jgi:hypothetical protein